MVTRAYLGYAGGMSPRAAAPPVSPLARRISDVFDAEREAQGMTHWTFAERMGVSKNYVSKRFRHEAAFTLTDFEMGCAVLGLDAATVVRAALRRS